MILQIIQDISYLIVLLSILLLGSTITYYALTDGGRQITDPDLVEPGVNGWMSQLVMLGYYMYQALLLGSFNYQDLNLISFPLMGKFIFVLLTFFVLIVLLNLLIALMSDSFERIKEREEQEYCYQTAKMIVNIEVKNLRSKNFLKNEAKQREYFPSYVHVLQPDQGQQVALDEWFGVAGQIRKDLNRTEKQLTSHIKDQLTNPNTGLEMKLQKSMNESIDHRLTVTQNEVTSQMTTLNHRIEKIEELLRENIRKMNHPGGESVDGTFSSFTHARAGSVLSSNR
jgi:hypothetical protein